MLVPMERGLGNQVGNEYRALGEENFKRIQPPVHYGPAEAERFGKTLEYLASIEKLTDVEMEFDKNPFWGMRRDDLAAIEIDEQNYTKEERYAASRAKYNMDRLYFSRLIEYANNTGDDRPLIKGYLEFLDSITPVERLNYPTDERDKVAARLARAEREQGSLPKISRCGNTSTGTPKAASTWKPCLTRRKQSPPRHSRRALPRITAVRGCGRTPSVPSPGAPGHGCRTVRESSAWQRSAGRYPPYVRPGGWR